MATANFRRPNTKYYYTIGADRDLEEFEYKDTIANIQSKLRQLKAYGYDEDRWLGRETQAIYSFTLEVFDQYYKEWNSAKLYVTIESGYYQGAMFDIDRSELDEYQLSKTTEAKIQRLLNKIEKILKSYTLPLVRVATFSNGETMYEPITSGHYSGQ